MTRRPRKGGPRKQWLVATTEYAGLTAYTGGIGSHYAALLPALVRSGVDVDLIVFSDAPPLPDAELDGVRLLAFHRTDAQARTVALFDRSRRVRAAYRKGRYDCVFLPEWCALGAGLPRRAPLLTNLATSARLANEISGLGLRDLPRGSRLPVALQIRREARQIRRSAGLIPISTAMLTRTESLIGDLPPAIIVRNCTDVGRVQSLSRSAAPPAGWPEGSDPIVLFLGRSERRKGVVEAVAAFGRLLERMPRARLVLAGAGGDPRFEPSRAELLDSVPRSARGRVRWLGHVSGGALYRAIREATVVMCPSRWEGFGNVAVEVKAVGTPLIVTTGSGFDDFCVDGVDCLMVPPHNALDLAAALARLLESPELGASLAGRARAGIGDFAPDAVAADLLSAAETLLRRR
ncbi:MAG: glycosyltransferase family 4 protein [Microbacterium sp.]